MIILSWNPLFWLLAFIFLFLISKYSMEQSSSWFWLTIFLLISYVQGLLFALTFNLPLKLFDYFENLSSAFPLSIMFSIFYFLLFLSLSNVYKILSKKSVEKFEDFSNVEIKSNLANLWGLSPEQIKIIQFDDGDNPNAHRAVSAGKLTIYFGKNFTKLLNDNQILFALSHEVAHYKGRDSRILFCLFFFLYIIFICFIGQLMASAMLLNPISFILLTFTLYIVGLMGINSISWQDEYSADYNGGAKVKEIQDIESFFKIEPLFQKDHGLLIDLIFFNHPSSQRRIEHIQKLKNVVSTRLKQ